MLRLPDPLVDAAWLAERLDNPDLIVIDVRWRLAEPGAGRALFDGGHIPGARYLDVDTDLAAPPSEGSSRHPLPDPGAFAATLARAGVSDDSAVVVYDDAGGSIAARLWWMLDVTGRAAAVLDGGMQAWTGDLTAESPHVAMTSPSVVEWPFSRCSDGPHLAAADVVVDARAAERYRGDVEPIDARAGHIPGAVNLPWTGNLDPASGRFLAPSTLAARFADVGVEPGAKVVAYCGSGVTACHTLLALRVGGLGDGRLYPGSWSEWSANESNPVATGPTPHGSESE